MKVKNIYYIFETQHINKKLILFVTLNNLLLSYKYMT
jgi:hypothetical protein